MARAWRYLIALGSNMRHKRHGSPARTLEAAAERLAEEDCQVVAMSPIEASAPLGPSHRTYANAALIAESTLSPPELLHLLQSIEEGFGRTRRGQRWGARVLDLDIVLWSGGAYSAPDLTIPHPHFRERAFVLDPAASVAAHWRDPITGLTITQLRARLTRPHALPR